MGQDGTMCHNTVSGGCRRALHATGGGLGVLHRKFFANISSEKGIFEQF